MSGPAVGDQAPDFTLPGTSPDGVRDYSLAAERGHPLVLAFYPGDETPVCTRQLCSYQDEFSVLTDVGATLWGISTQGMASHEKFAAHRGLSFPLLADVGGTVAELYGVKSVLGTRRSVFVVDADGRVSWRHVSLLGLTYQGARTIARAVQAATG